MVQWNELTSVLPRVASTAPATFNIRSWCLKICFLAAVLYPGPDFPFMSAVVARPFCIQYQLSERIIIINWLRLTCILTLASIMAKLFRWFMFCLTRAMHLARSAPGLAAALRKSVASVHVSQKCFWKTGLRENRTHAARCTFTWLVTAWSSRIWSYTVQNPSVCTNICDVWSSIYLHGAWM